MVALRLCENFSYWYWHIFFDILYNESNEIITEWNYDAVGQVIKVTWYIYQQLRGCSKFYFCVLYAIYHKYSLPLVKAIVKQWRTENIKIANLTHSVFFQINQLTT